MSFTRNTIALLATALAVGACDRGAKPFQMKVDDVQSMRGFVMNGLGAGGTVEQGCIANHDDLIVKREGKVVYETKAIVLSLDGREGFEAPEGHKVVFYLRDAADGVVQIGDTLEAKDKTNCKKDN